MKTKECIGCGYCCRKAPCTAAVRLYGNVTKCPALFYEGGRYICSLMRLPGKLGAAYQEELGAGTGCCCGLNSDRQNIPPPEPPKEEGYRMSRDAQVLLSAMAKEWLTGDQLWMICNRAAHDLNEPRFMTEAKRLFASQRATHVEGFMG